MKKLLLLSILSSILFVLSGCDLNISNQETTNNVDGEKNLVKEISVENEETVNEQESDVTSYTDLNQFLGKPTILIWGSTTCPHCVNAMPIFEKDIYNVYDWKINLLLNTLSPNTFETGLPQIQNSPFSFESVSGESCGYIPQWIMLDAEGNIAEKSCGGEKEIEEIKVKLWEMGIE